jgi:hypothetical protein
MILLVVCAKDGWLMLVCLPHRIVTTLLAGCPTQRGHLVHPCHACPVRPQGARGKTHNSNSSVIYPRLPFPPALLFPFLYFSSFPSPNLPDDVVRKKKSICVFVTLPHIRSYTRFAKLSRSLLDAVQKRKPKQKKKNIYKGTGVVVTFNS